MPENGPQQPWLVDRADNEDGTTLLRFVWPDGHARNVIVPYPQRPQINARYLGELITRLAPTHTVP